MKIVSTFHQPSSVTASAKCHLTEDRNLVHLVIARVNRLEVYSARPVGLRHECGSEIWGRITSLKALPTKGVRDHLLLMTDHPDPKVAIIAYRVSSTGEGSLFCLRTIDLQERGSIRHAEFFHDIVVSLSGAVAIASCYAGKLKVFVLDDGELKSEFDVTISEFSLLSLTIISKSLDHHVVAILHVDHQQRMQLVAHDLHISHYELSQGASLVLPATSLSTTTFPLGEFPPTLITIPSLHQSALHDGDDDEAFSGGVLVLGGRKVLLYELSSEEWREKYRGKQKRLDSQKKSPYPNESAKAKEKQRERDFRRRKAKATVEWPWAEVTAWCQANDAGSRYLLGDAWGRLALLALDSLQSHGLILIPLGIGTYYLDLCHCTNAFPWITCGRLSTPPHPSISSFWIDALTLEIPPEVPTLPPSSLIFNNKGKGKSTVEVRVGEGCVVAAKGQYLEVVDTWKNIAPILDASVVDTDNSGQPHIVTCSGMKNTGSLRVIRNGADFREKAVVKGLAKFTHLWPIRKRYMESFDSYLLASDGFETSFFRLSSPDTIAHVDASNMGLVTSSPTLAAGNVARSVKKLGGVSTSYEDSSYIIQVTVDRVILLEFDEVVEMYSVITEWKAEASDILLASINASQVLLALGGGQLVVLKIGDNNQFNKLGSKTFGQEIAAVSCIPINDKPYSHYATVGFWGSDRLEILSLSNPDMYLMPICEGITLPALPRSVLLCNLGSEQSIKSPNYHPYLLVGLTDGTLLAYSFHNKELKDPRVISLGTAPVILTNHVVKGQPIVFASGSRAAVQFWNNGRFQSSPVPLKNIMSSCHLQTPYWDSCLATVTQHGLVVGSVYGLDKMHIHSVCMGFDNPRSIAHDPLTGTFGVASIHSEPGRIGEHKQVKSLFTVFDDTTFDCLGKLECGYDEEITAVHSVTNALDNGFASFYSIGLVTHQDNETEPSTGRLLMLTATKSPTTGLLLLEEACHVPVMGCVYAINSLGDYIAVAINSSVIVYQFQAKEGFSLEKISDWTHNFFVTSLASYGSSLATGDAINSVSVLEFDTEKGLETVARDYGPLWPVSLGMYDQTNLIGANSDCNLFAFNIQSIESRRTLERNGSYHLDDLVNRFLLGGIHGQDVSQSSYLQPKTIFFTSSGRIGCVIDVEQGLALHLTALQRNLSKVEEDIIGTNHTRWRAPTGGMKKTDAEAAYGFLDGDFLEQFLTYNHPSAALDRVMMGSNSAENLQMDQDGIRQALENLQSLH